MGALFTDNTDLKLMAEKKFEFTAVRGPSLGEALLDLLEHMECEPSMDVQAPKVPSIECEVSTNAPSLDVKVLGATAAGEEATADAEDVAAAAEPSDELKEVAAELVASVKGAAQWPMQQAQNWLEGLVKRGRTAGLQELCSKMSHGFHPALEGKGQEFRDALHPVLFNSEIWAAAEFAFPEAAAQGAAVEAPAATPALDSKAPKTPPKLQQACTKGDIAAAKELLKTEQANVNWTNQASISYVYCCGFH